MDPSDDCPLVPTGVLLEQDFEIKSEDVELSKVPKDRVIEVVWRNVAFFAYVHLSALYGLYLLIVEAKWESVAFVFVVLINFAGLGITGGAHRLWAHRSFKAKLPLKIILVVANSMAFQDAVIDWVRDHRLHHKYSETDADPYNASRGFFFSHIGWLLCRKLPEVKEKGKGIDLSDLYSDPILVFQKRYYMIVMPLCTFLIPMCIPCYFWNEQVSISYHMILFYYCVLLNGTWLVNSAAHLYGNKPYDRFINPAENLLVSYITNGEGFHNYHHTFPWDYRTSEHGFLFSLIFNNTTIWLDLFGKIGWAYGFKSASPEMVKQRIQRTGDGSHHSVKVKAI